MTVRRMIGAAAAVGLLTIATSIGSTSLAFADNHGSGAGSESESKTGWVTLSASGSGEDEIPAGSGEEGTKATGSFSFSEEKGEMKYTVSVTGNGEELTSAHIHKGEDGANGDVVIELDAAAVNDGTAGTVEVDPAIISRILANPAGYYLNSHSESYKPPTGVARAQLTDDAEEPDVINTGTGGQASSSAPDAALLAAGGVLVLASAAGATMALRRRSGTDNA